MTRRRLAEEIWDTITLPSMTGVLQASVRVDEDEEQSGMEIDPGDESSTGVRLDPDEDLDEEGHEYGSGEYEERSQDGQHYEDGSRDGAEYEERYQDEEEYEGAEQYVEDAERDGSTVEDDRDDASPPPSVSSPPSSEGSRLGTVQEEDEEEQYSVEDGSVSGRARAGVAASRPLLPPDQPFSLPTAFSFTFSPHPGPILDDVRQELKGLQSGGVTLSRQQMEDIIGRLDEVSERLRGTDDELVTVRNELLDLMEGTVDGDESRSG